MTNPTDRLDHDLRQALVAIDELTLRAAAVLHRDHRGGTNEHDGYPASSLGGGGGAYTVDSTSTTAAAAEARLEDGAGKRDEVGRCARALTLHLNSAIQHLHSAVSMVALAEHLSNPDGRHSNPPTECRACNRMVECTTADPMRAGYCSSCSTSWYRYRKAELVAGRDPDRARFEKTQRATKAKAS